MSMTSLDEEIRQMSPSFGNMFPSTHTRASPVLGESSPAAPQDPYEMGSTPLPPVWARPQRLTSQSQSFRPVQPSPLSPQARAPPTLSQQPRPVGGYNARRGGYLAQLSHYGETRSGSILTAPTAVYEQVPVDSRGRPEPGPVPHQLVHGVWVRRDDWGVGYDIFVSGEDKRFIRLDDGNVVWEGYIEHLDPLFKTSNEYLRYLASGEY